MSDYYKDENNNLKQQEGSEDFEDIGTWETPKEAEYPNEPKPKGKSLGIKPLLYLVIICLVIYLVASGIRLLYTFDVFHMNENLAIIKKMTEVERFIDKYYFREPEGSDLEDGIYKGIVEALDDPYSEFFTAEEYKAYTESSTGKYAGIGAVLTQDENTKKVTVTSVYEDSPAADAGIEAGDTIVSANGLMATSMDLSTFVTHLRGEPGTDVSVVYIHKDEEIATTITRREIISPTVKWELLDDNTGYIQISEFKENTETEFSEAISALEKIGIGNIVYDLRSNPGGLVSSATKILDDILPKGLLVYLEDKYGERIEYNSDDAKQLPYPCVVLVDQNTASASEIFTGAIMDFDYGTVIGTTTFGKGVVQNSFILSDGSAVKLTIAEYFTPKGNNIHGKGITPDIELEYEYLSPNDTEYNPLNDNQVQKALEILD